MMTYAYPFKNTGLLIFQSRYNRRWNCY